MFMIWGYPWNFKGGEAKVKKVGNIIWRKQVTQKVNQVGQLFGWGLRPQTRGATPFLGVSSLPKNENC